MPCVEFFARSQFKSCFKLVDLTFKESSHSALSGVSHIDELCKLTKVLCDNVSCHVTVAV